ncbi:MAG: iron-containing alcohol dehydrogenase [Actinomycetota bacterium]
MDLPELFVYDEGDEDDAAKDLAQQIARSGIESPLVVASVHGARLAAGIEGVGPPATPVGAADQAWAVDLGTRAKQAGADAVIAVGGGRSLDLGKLAAARAGLIVIAVPTQLSHDGICSPVAVVPGPGGRAESIGAIPPRFVYLSIPTLIGAPAPTVAAGIGDLLANPLALRDWALAAERGHEEVDPRAWDLSTEAFTAIEPFLDDDPVGKSADPAFLRTLANSLVLSGMAMIQSGTSRPASGGEHEISHAIDHLHGSRALHGAQVAFGCIFSVALYGEDTTAFRQRLQRLGLPDHPRSLGFSKDEVAHVLLEAPQTRPGRFTILEEANLDHAAATALVERIWPE